MQEQSQFLFTLMIEQLVTDLMNSWNTHDIERMMTFYAPDYEGSDISQAQPNHGPDGVRFMFERIVRGFPDISFTLDQTITQGSEVVLIWTAQGTHQGHIMKIPPTGRRIAVRGSSVLTLEDGKIKKALYIWDVAGILRGIGLLPEL
jgi:steroid delta-isomerase-like uncharacterized protein